MNRSKNHVLYEMYLLEKDELALFTKTSRYSLGHIVKFVEIYNELRDGQTAKELMHIATGEVYDQPEDMSDKDFSLYSAIKGLWRTIDASEVDILDDVIYQIDQYHENKRNQDG